MECQVPLLKWLSVMRCLLIFHVIWYHYNNMKNFGCWRIIITYIPFRRFDEYDIILIYNLWWEQKLPKLTGNSPKESSPTPRWLRKMGLQGWINLKPWNFAGVSNCVPCLLSKCPKLNTRWWFQILFIFIPDPWGNDLIFDEHIFQMGWNHQPEQHFHFIFPIFDLPHQLSQLDMKKLAFQVVRKTDESQAQRESQSVCLSVGFERNGGCLVLVKGVFFTF